MAQLYDTEINGNLNVSGDIQIGETSVTDEISKLNTNMEELNTSINSINESLTSLSDILTVQKYSFTNSVTSSPIVLYKFGNTVWFNYDWTTEVSLPNGNTNLGTLPEGWRPADHLNIKCYTNTVQSGQKNIQLGIQTGGAVNIYNYDSALNAGTLRFCAAYITS